MGAWGTAVSSNDDYKDIYYEIKDYLNKEIELDDVLKKVTEKYEVEFSDDENALNNFTSQLHMQNGNVALKVRY